MLPNMFALSLTPRRGHNADTTGMEPGMKRGRHDSSQIDSWQTLIYSQSPTITLKFPTREVSLTIPLKVVVPSSEDKVELVYSEDKDLQEPILIDVDTEATFNFMNITMKVAETEAFRDNSHKVVTFDIQKMKNWNISASITVKIELPPGFEAMDDSGENQLQSTEEQMMEMKGNIIKVEVVMKKVVRALL
tara:strand:+ start:143 stop:715 length:573 start_codon:yes stop_codon:yes gene_type:complete